MCWTQMIRKSCKNDIFAVKYLAKVCLLLLLDEEFNNIQSESGPTYSHVASQEWCFILFGVMVMCIKSIPPPPHSATGVMWFSEQIATKAVIWAPIAVVGKK